jgi:hypothetical protein
MTTEDKQTLGMDDMFAHDNVPVEAPVESPPEPQRETAPVTPAADRARDEQGRFASPEAVKPAPVTLTPAPTPAATPDADPEKQPISRAEFKGYLDEKSKRKAAEDRAAALEARIQQFERQQPAQIPSIHTDPEAYNQHIQNQIDEARIYERTIFSEVLAKEKYGEELVQAAENWGSQQIQTVPGFLARHRAEAHPIDWLVKQYKRDATIKDLGDDPDAYVRRRAAELGLIGQAPPQTDAPPSQAASPQPASDPPPQAPAPTRSIANATSAGGLQVVPPQGEFAALDLAHKH